MKIIFVEPNLKTVSGHVFEATKALAGYFADSQKQAKVDFVCHIDADKNVFGYLPSVKPMYRLSCFEQGEVKIVIEDLEAMVDKFQLGRADVVVFTTAHLRDIEAANAVSKINNSPRFILQLHQYYPPLVNADMIFNEEAGKKLGEKYKEVLGNLNNEKVKIVITPVHLLAEKIFDVSGYRPSMFSVPFAPSTNFKRDGKFKKEMTLGFLGDGRKEKGLLEFLRFTEEASKSNDFNDFRFVVQIQNPRGYSADELNEIRNLKVTLLARKSVEVNSGPLDSEEYYKKLRSCDVVFVLHYSKHYSIRLSGIAVECGMIGMPVIAYDGTSIGEWIKEGKLYGELIKEDGLRGALFRLKERVNDFPKTQLEQLSQFWLKEYSAENYVNNYLIPLIYNYDWK
ncbi:glycosyltransferase [Candidatus Collierbacteria bacterium]|nr:glycosyltransferase [Candidatus Collierbacteria bacterium]